MIAAAAFCPHPPVLVPDAAQGAAPELDELRSACRSAITRIASPGRQLAVLGSGPVSRRYPSAATGTLAGYGVPVQVSLGSELPGNVELPLSLTVGAWLLRDTLSPHTGAVGYAIGPDGAVPDLADEAGLLVMGDGSARRSTAAPGYLDERSEPFDARVAAALSTGDAAALATLSDPGLLAAGVPAWRAAGALLTGRRYDAQLLYDAAPYGVGYFVAVWT